MSQPTDKLRSLAHRSQTSQAPQTPEPDVLPFSWGRHIPNQATNTNENIFFRLSCALLNFITSPFFLTSQPIIPRPYFIDSNISVENALLCYYHEVGPSTGIEELRRVHGMEPFIPLDSTVVFSIRTMRDFDEKGRTRYNIQAQAHILDDEGRCIKGMHPRDGFEDIAAFFVAQWPVSREREEIGVDPSVDLEWKVLATILKCEVEFSCDGDGELISDREKRERMLRDMNPLRGVGLLGWPAYERINESMAGSGLGRCARTFRRAGEVVVD